MLLPTLDQSTFMQRKYIFPAVLVFFEMATYLSSDMYLPALPTVIKNFAISNDQGQLTLMAWFLGAISVQLILGPLADRYGRKSILCFGAILFTLSTLACALTTSFHAFLLARFIQGTGICFMAVPGYACIHESFDRKEAIKLLTLMGSIAVLAPALGPLLGSIILIRFDWRMIFYFLVVWSFIATLLLVIWMPETLTKDKRHALNLSLILKNYLKILLNRRFMAIISVYGLLLCGFITWIVAGPFLVIEYFQYSPISFSIFQGFIFICYICANHLVKYLIDKKPLNKIILNGLSLCLVICTLSFISAILVPKFLFGMIITYMIYAFGSGFVFAPLNRLAIESTNEPMGSRMAVFSTLMSGFATLSSVLVTLFFSGTLFSLALILLIVIAIAWIIEFNRQHT